MKGLRGRIELLRAVAHPARIKILEELSKGVKCVSDFGFLEINQPNVSQHLAALRNRGIIDFYMYGRLRCYYLADAFIPDLLEILKKEYASPLPAPACCPVTKRGSVRAKEENDEKTKKRNEKI